MDEATPLLKPSTNAKQDSWIHKLQWKHTFSVKYRLPVITERGAIIILLWNFMMSIAMYCTALSQSTALSDIMLLTFPIAGYVADTWVGRFRVLQASMLTLLVSALFGIGAYTAQIWITSAVIPVLIEVHFGIGAMGIGFFTSCFIPFTTDQLTGASGEQLSFGIYWLLWGATTGLTVSIALNSSYVSSISFAPLLIQILAVLLLLLSAFVIWYWKDSLMTVPQLTNPIKHIGQVLNYARKHKYPERRSALTYWEEDYPSRIDLGKSKYGGPFTFEEVEDVKTVFRLIPVVLCAGVFNLGSWISGSTNYSLRFMGTFWNFLFQGYTFGFLLLSIGLPLYHFIIYPLFYNYIPNMLKRIGTGFFLVLISYFLSLCTCMLGSLSYSESYDDNNSSALLSMANNSSPFWLVLPAITYNIGFVTVLVSLTEFVAAQAPIGIVGLLTGTVLLYVLVTGAIGWLICYLVSYFIPIQLLGLPTPFYIVLMIACLSLIAFIMYVRVSRNYKLRERNDIIPIHMFAENYFEKEHAREKAYYKKVSSYPFTI